MRRLTFLVDAGNPDTDGRHKLIFSGLVVPAGGLVPLVARADYLGPPVGTARVFLTARGLEAEADVPDEFLLAYPVLVLGEVCYNHMPPVRRFIIQCRLLAVALCAAPNADPTIACLLDQCPPDVPRVSEQ